jgi:hypothetical protein
MCVVTTYIGRDKVICGLLVCSCNDIRMQYYVFSLYPMSGSITECWHDLQ